MTLRIDRSSAATCLLVAVLAASALGCVDTFAEPPKPPKPTVLLPDSSTVQPSDGDVTASPTRPSPRPFGMGTAGAAAPPASPFGAVAGMGAFGDEDAGVPVLPGVLTAWEAELAHTLTPLPGMPLDATNAFADDLDAATLGRSLFDDPGFSGPLTADNTLGAAGETGKVSCATCHFGPALVDPGNAVSVGTGKGTRNSPSLINSALQPWTNWGGRFSAQWELPIAVVENPAIFNGNRLSVAHRIFEQHRFDYEQVFGALPAALSDLVRFPATAKPKPAAKPGEATPADGAWEAMTDEDRAIVNAILVNYGKALGAFLRTLVSGDAPFDRFVAGDAGALRDEAQRGLQLFVGKARCVLCHDGPLLSDGAFHNVGVPPLDPMAAVDDGRFKDIPGLLASPFSSATMWSDDPSTGRLLGLTNPPPEETRGQFRTPSLRGVAQSGPYFHNGALSSLDQVIEHYDEGGGEPQSGTRDHLLAPLHLSDQEKLELRAFLESLGGAPVDETLTTPEPPRW